MVREPDSELISLLGQDMRRKKEEYTAAAENTGNKNPTVYRMTSIMDRRELLTKKFYSEDLVISNYKGGLRGLSIYFDTPKGEVFYLLAKERIVRQFISDVINYTPDISLPDVNFDNIRLEEIIGKKVEVFFYKGSRDKKEKPIPFALSPIFPVESDNLHSII